MRTNSRNESPTWAPIGQLRVQDGPRETVRCPECDGEGAHVYHNWDDTDPVYRPERWSRETCRMCQGWRTVRRPARQGEAAQSGGA